MTGLLKVSAALNKLLDSGVGALGFELVYAELVGRGKGEPLLRVYIDGPEGINIEDCAQVTRQLSALLDVEDLIPGHYVLEVSSPGLDRPLVRAADFDRFAGETVKIKTHRALNGRRNFTGRLLGLQAEESGAEAHVLLEVDNQRCDFALSDIDTARLVPKY